MDSIGRFQFVSLTGSPETPQRLVQVTSRPGVDGTSFFLMEKRGLEFTLKSLVDCADMADALDTLEAYKGLADDGPQSLVWAGVDYARYLLDVQVVRVTGRAAPILKGVGGALASPRAKLEADWHLILVEQPTS